MAKYTALAAYALSLIAVAVYALERGKDSKLTSAEDFGPYQRQISTASPEAQRHFNEGLTWMHAFDHDEAIRSFRQAAEVDDNCAMAWWGISLASGPQYNHPEMTEERTERAWRAMHEALGRIDHATPVERALIEALQHRNVEVEPDESGRAKLNRAYADAMGNVWNDYPNDPDVGALFAEAQMVLKPWQLYDNADRTPVDGTLEIVSTLERVLAIAPNHPGALHLYIHAVEPSKRPERAMFAADRLCNLVPISGHLNHMPSHIYVQTGRWDQAITRNEVAMVADDLYQQSTVVPEVQNGYIIHNTHMLVFAAMMSGREKEAMAAARHMWKDYYELLDEEPTSIDPELSYVDRLMCAVYDVQKRFSRWDDLLAEPEPPKYLVVTQALWRANRAVACAAKHNFPAAEREYELFKAAKARVPDDYPEIERARSLVDITDHFVAGEMALQKGITQEAQGHAELAEVHFGESVAHLEVAAKLEDAARYGEPPEPIQPVRHTLGVAYIKAKRLEDAERVYREDLSKWPANGWSLKGLSLALAAQIDDPKKLAESKVVKRQYDHAWQNADNPIESSCLCVRDCCPCETMP